MFEVYTDFYCYGSGVYTKTCGSLEGGHPVLVTGWDDTAPKGGAFIVKNSWGTSWGMEGYFEIAYSELTDDTQFGSWTYGYGKAIYPHIKAQPWLELLLQ